MTPDEALEARVIEALRHVIDPELGLNVVDLGLVYGVGIEDGQVHVQLTLTSPACPLGEHLVQDAETRLRELDDVIAVTLELVWEPPWSPARMSPSARQALGWAG